MQGERFTFAPDVADEVSDLLLEENKRRFEAEAARGIHTAPRERVHRVGETLFGDDEDLDEESGYEEDEEQE
jgi:hypothetical protein